MSLKIKIVLADDHEIVRDGLKTLLEKERDFEVVGMAGDGQETIRMLSETEADIAVMDINMPNLSGVEATKQIQSEFPRVKVLILSVHTDSEMVGRMLEAGASGYLPKSCAAQELIEAVRMVMRNHTYISPKVSDSVIAYLQRQPAPKDSLFESLTVREREVLQLIAEGKSTKEIANQLHVSDSTAETHRLKIMEKLNIHSIAELTKYAIRKGLTSIE
ncbi:MAG TPA: response regulator transcription factor [bacterium]|nr:response regulator transcription factor [bacterium]